MVPIAVAKLCHGTPGNQSEEFETIEFNQDWGLPTYTQDKNLKIYSLLCSSRSRPIMGKHQGDY